jgi:hypothetical protein
VNLRSIDMVRVNLPKYCSLLAVKLTQLSTHFFRDLLGRLLLVLIRKCPVVMGIDDHRCCRLLGVDRITLQCVVDSLLQIPTVGNDDWNG